MYAVFCLLVAIAAEVLGTAALKQSEQFTRLWPSVVVVISYGSAAILLSKCLETLPMGLVYALWSGLGTVAVAVMCVTVFGESLKLSDIAGIGFIIVGVVSLNIGGSPNSVATETVALVDSIENPRH